MKLIEDEIKFSRLANLLSKLNIEAYSYTTNNAPVIFDLMKIPEDRLTEELEEEYYRIIEQGANIEKYDTSEKLHQLAAEVYAFLLKFSN